jgi:quercetin dioxygenase-like cupin family protein
MVCELVWKKGQIGTVHTHPHTQCGYIITGKFEAEINGQKQILGPGECFYTKANEAHGLVCLEDGVTLDVFTPKRDDFLK